MTDLESLDKEALNETIPMWERLAQTGGTKREYFEYKGIRGEDIPICGCYLCEISKGCFRCPLWREYPITNGYGGCHRTYYSEWEYAQTTEARKKYAGLFVQQLKDLRCKIISRGGKS